MSFSRRIHDFLFSVLRIERRFDPFFRPLFDCLFREPLTRLTEASINAFRRDEGLALAEECLFPDEEALMDRMITEMSAFMRSQYRPGAFERGGNTKTHGVVRAEFTIREDLPEEMRAGLFASPKTFPAWVRFGGPGPASPPDIDDVGVLSIGIKLMGVPGPKLLDDEQHTLDFTGISTPVFTTPDSRENAKLQFAIRRGTPLFYFIGFPESHLRDAIIQGLWSRTQTSPLETSYWSCAPCLLGEGRAMKYSLRPCSRFRTKIPRLPARPPDNYLRDAMASRLASEDAAFDFLIQLQTDPHRMPVEHSGVRWPARLSPPVRAAVLRIPAQKFDSPAQLAFARDLSYNPWHCIAEHRPLGNLNRARRRVYQELSRFRQQMNRSPHVEPTGEEVFD